MYVHGKTLIKYVSIYLHSKQYYTYTNTPIHTYNKEYIEALHTSIIATYLFICLSVCLSICLSIVDTIEHAMCS